MLLRALIGASLAAYGVRSFSTGVASTHGQKVQREAKTRAGRHRPWVEVPRPPDAPGQTQKEVARIRVLSYNVLGPKHALTAKHNYCPQSLRSWRGRSKRLEDEIRKYHESVEGGLQAVCLQEVTPKTFRETWVPFMKKIGLDGHVYQPKQASQGRHATHRCLGVAVFYNKSQLEATMGARVFFPREAELLRVAGGDGDGDGSGDEDPTPPRGPTPPADVAGEPGSSGDEGIGAEGGGAKPARELSRLESDLRSLPDGAVILRLRLRGGNGDGDGDGEDGYRPAVTLVCCHLWYNPRRPDIKTAQCGMLLDAIKRFHAKCGCGTGDSVPAEGTANGDSRGVEATNLILCGDFNAVPMLQPEFLLGPLKVAAEEACSASDRSMIAPAPQSLIGRTGRYPSGPAAASGVYSLLAYGRVPSTHPDHPDSFIPELMAQEAAGDYTETSAIRRGGRHRAASARRGRREEGEGRPEDAPRDPPPHRPVGDWTSGYGCELEDVYGNRGGAAPVLTTKTSDFYGIIDHIFVSSGESGGPTVRGFLRLPPGAEVASAGDPGGGVDVAGTDSPAHGDAVESIPGGGGFQPIPDRDYGSDHLALGVEVALY